jgi:hypothetical protein
VLNQDDSIIVVVSNNPRSSPKVALRGFHSKRQTLADILVNEMRVLLVVNAIVTKL